MQVLFGHSISACIESMLMIVTNKFALNLGLGQFTDEIEIIGSEVLKLINIQIVKILFDALLDRGQSIWIEL